MSISSYLISILFVNHSWYAVFSFSFVFFKAMLSYHNQS